ncbi:MAG: hypothetical protein DI626_11345, partial [Micavibrio aeruginosavorus]
MFHDGNIGLIVFIYHDIWQIIYLTYYLIIIYTSRKIYIKKGCDMQIEMGRRGFLKALLGTAAQAAIPQGAVNFLAPVAEAVKDFGPTLYPKFARRFFDLMWGDRFSNVAQLVGLRENKNIVEELLTVHGLEKHKLNKVDHLVAKYSTWVSDMMYASKCRNVGAALDHIRNSDMLSDEQKKEWQDMGMDFLADPKQIRARVDDITDRMVDILNQTYRHAGQNSHYKLLSVAPEALLRSDTDRLTGRIGLYMRNENASAARFTREDLHMLAERRFFGNYHFSANYFDLRAKDRDFLKMMEDHPLTKLRRWRYVENAGGFGRPEQVFNAMHGQGIAPYTPPDADMADLFDQMEKTFRRGGLGGVSLDEEYLFTTRNFTPDQFVRHLEETIHHKDLKQSADILDRVKFVPVAQNNGAGMEGPADTGYIGLYTVSYPNVVECVFSGQSYVGAHKVVNLLKENFSDAVRVKQHKDGEIHVRLPWTASNDDLKFTDAKTASAPRPCRSAA